MKIHIRNLKHNRLLKSFTLIEMTTVIGILALVITVTTGVLISVVKAYDKQRVIAEIQRNGDFAIRVLEENLRNATSVTCVTKPSVDPLMPDVDCVLPTDITHMDHLLKITDENETIYVGREERNSDGASSDNCGGSPANNNFYVFYTDDPDAPFAPPTNTWESNSLTNHSNIGVNITDFVFTVDAPEDNFTEPTRVTANIVIADSVCGTNWENEERSFQTFVTVRGSY